MSNKSDEKVRQKHKHYDCIVAWAEGKKIEFLDSYGEWVWCGEFPLWYENKEYRIKPEPKPDLVYYGYVFDSEENVEFEGFCNVLDKFNDNLKLTFDGETGKLKSAEVLDV